MNIREAAAQVESAMRAYSAKGPDGRYRVALAAQRPVYLIGPPGVGKTAAVAQAARRMGVGFAAYTMTHHTRQSALGLPVVARRTVNGRDCAVTEYTMSEIVAEVWAQADAGAESGILFLDEINCVSESLMPAMLQLLQYKTFGVHALPRGWMIACAGNPPKYNRYAHTFDAVVLDRLRVIEVEPDIEAWRRFAAAHGTHPSVRSYLEMRPEDFYAADGDRMVTARSWTDLSDAMLALEAAGESPDALLFGQYLQIEAVAARFAMYHRLCEGMKARLDGVLSGESADLRGAPFDEALFAAMLVADRVAGIAAAQADARRRAERVGYFADGVARAVESEGISVRAACDRQAERLEGALATRIRINAVEEGDAAVERAMIAHLKEIASRLRGMDDEAALAALRVRAASEAEPVARGDASLDDAIARSLDFIERDVDDPNVRMVFLDELDRHAGVRARLRGSLGERFATMRQDADPDVRAARLGMGGGGKTR